ncbi:prephenate dehydratase [Arsenicicoccus piscis]|uniref:Prephenate dehydratase n=1 Tax=Arsenicicoccus piscis TaxID=673954 RepID=A0ABQ6HU62_9MICO|nr:prephenate dehydratase [Arsenicicoccus piscis]
MRYAYFGPAGTFTEQALLSWLATNQVDGERVPIATVDGALAALRAGTVDRAVVPIENSVEGGVPSTLDALSAGDPLEVVGEVLVPITFVLAAAAGVTLADITAVGTHSHAWAQVRGWMSANLPDALYVPTLSTASAAEGLSVGRDAGGSVSGSGGSGSGGSRSGGSADVPETASYQAAVCAPVAATTHGLEVLATGIGDNAGAVTRFVVVARPGAIPHPTGADKTTVVLYQREDRAGALLEMLEQLAARGINMTRLESRPTGAGMGSYCFSLDFEGHVLDERVGETLTGLHRICADVRFLGSYPRADRTAATIDDLATDDAFLEARSWLRSLRHREGLT